ncbi:hypothetical protein F4V43_01160 [Paenibacillus spiritus]|uniref:Uncharacterized protein n=1 Tax=Paenibacillus spiritus TaxID=2496557 RepID=A0A5J5GJF5_9BACL|nr:hypothetical protein [Paenibacillus spiritus]KAA9008389.1 hypothetical protein F4V43_01160 [Paenibacillus spiritus]
MSAYDDYAREKEAVDEQVSTGYAIAGIAEDLDGAVVRFVRGEPAPAAAELRLLTADARKYVTTLLVAAKRTAG